LVDRLIEFGHEVYVIDNFSSGFREYLPIDDVCFIDADISNYVDLIKYLSWLKNVDGVFHLAAQSRIQPAIHNPDLAHNNNISGIYNILKLMRELDIPKIVFSSSSSIYGLKNNPPQVETMEVDPLNPYALSKYVGEQYIKVWCKLYGIEGVSLRYFNVWGPREVIHLKDVAPIVGLFFRKLLKDKEPLTIIGDGSMRRDFTSVVDVVDANLRAMRNEQKFQGDVFNIGTGKNYSILELADIVLHSLGYDSSYKEFLPPRPAEAKATKANNEKAKRILGWYPQINLENKIDEHRDYYLCKWNIKV